MKIITQSKAEEAAGKALAETRRVLCNGSANPDPTIPGTQFRIRGDLAQDELRKKRRVPNIYSRVSNPTPQDRVMETLCDARISMGARCGNCDEHASVVFAMLFMMGYYPISKWCFPQNQGDHAFVIVGPHDQPHVAVICDAWADGWCWLSKADEWKEFLWKNPAERPQNRPILRAMLNDFEGNETMFWNSTAAQPWYNAMELCK
jgi:hypothetical protein